MVLREQTLVDITDALQEEYDGSLRALGGFDDGDYERYYIRDDVRERLGEGTAYQILEDAQLGSLSRDLFEDLFESDLQGKVQIFEDTVAMTVPVSENTGVVLSLDRRADFQRRQVIELVTDHIEN